MKVIILTIIIVLLSWTSSVSAQGTIPPDFPVIENSGDVKADNAKYDQAKKVWVEANPEAYQNMGGQIQFESEINDNTLLNDNDNCEEDENVVVPENCIAWSIIDAVIIDENNELKLEDFDQQQASFKNEMLIPNLLWQISPDNILYIENNGKYVNHFKFEQLDNELKLFAPNDSSCNDEIKIYQIKKWTDTQIILILTEEDENSDLLYQLTLFPEL